MTPRRCRSWHLSGWRIVRCVRRLRDCGDRPHEKEHISSGKGGVVKWPVKQGYWGV